MKHLYMKHSASKYSKNFKETEEILRPFFPTQCGVFGPRHNSPPSESLHSSRDSLSPQLQQLEQRQESSEGQTGFSHLRAFSGGRSEVMNGGVFHQISTPTALLEDLFCDSLCLSLPFHPVPQLLNPFKSRREEEAFAKHP